MSNIDYRTYLSRAILGGTYTKIRTISRKLSSPSANLDCPSILFGEARGVIVIVVVNRYGDLSANPG